MLWDEVVEGRQMIGGRSASLPGRRGLAPARLWTAGGEIDGTEFIVVAASATVSVRARGERVRGRVMDGNDRSGCFDQPPGATIRLLGLTVTVLLPTAAVRYERARDLMPRGGSSKALRRALSLIGTPYLWGGMTARGVDCSGLVQVAYRAVGMTLPRDADMQYDAARPVPRKELRAGDAAFLQKDGRITHVMMMADRDHLVHAYGPPGQVQMNTLAMTAYSTAARDSPIHRGTRG